jgi:hypothetical protein
MYEIGDALQLSIKGNVAKDELTMPDRIKVTDLQVMKTMRLT